MSDPIGVVMVNINGLKEANDGKGHSEGDYMIEDTAAFHRSITYTQLPYRIGRDEFALLLTVEKQEDIEKYLMKIIAFKDVFISCGSSLAENGSYIDQAIQETDNAMYNDKIQYYRNHERKHVGQ